MRIIRTETGALQKVFTATTAATAAVAATAAGGGA